MSDRTDKPTPMIESARELMQRVFGHDAFREGQADAVESILAGRNVLVVMPTGSGKSLIYQLPALMTDGLTLVVSPLIALMKDQVDELQQRGAPADFINSSLGYDQQRDRIRRCESGEIKLLYVAPERFRSRSFLRMLDNVRVTRLVVDEAHCISEWGHDFRPDYRRLKDFRARMPHACVSALTATATPRVQRDIVECLALTPDEVEVHVHGFDRPNLSLAVRRASDEDRKNAICTRMAGGIDGPGIVYCGTRKAADSVAEHLRAVEKKTVVYHAGLDPDKRRAAQEAFLTGRARICVATIAFGMGIDKPNIRFVIHYHYPGSVEGYYQEIGRAGRDGKPSECLLLHAHADRSLREFFIDLSHPTREQVQDVYETLWTVRDNPVLMTYREIARLCDADVKDGQVGAALRLLNGAGVTRALTGDPTLGVTVKKPGAEIIDAIRGPNQRSVFEALATEIDLESPGDYRIDLGELCRAAGLDDLQVRRALQQLDQAGHIGYEPPFRGRGVEKVGQKPVPFATIPIDWERQDFLRKLEEDKLADMEAYIRERTCRRNFILRYFGEKPEGTCGHCDCCEMPRDARDGAPEGDGVTAQYPDITAALLVAARTMRFPVGGNRLAQVVTGSKDKQILKWRLDKNPAYNRVHAKQAIVKRVIEDLVEEGYFEPQGDFKRPTLGLSERGLQAAYDIDLDAATAEPIFREDKPARRRKQTPALPAEDDRARLVLAVLQCVDEMERSVGIGKVAEVVTGSNASWIAQWRADQLAAYDTVGESQKVVKDVIRFMIRDHLLEQVTEGRYPVLRITPAGKRKLGDVPVPTESAPSSVQGGPEGRRSNPAVRPAENAATGRDLEIDYEPEPEYEPDWEDVRAEMLHQQRDPEPEAASAEPPGTPADPAALLDGLVDRLLVCERTEAARLVTDLRLFRPEEIVARLRERFQASEDVRPRSRAVWAAGELCGRDGIDFIAGSASDAEADVRRFAAGALAKAMAGVRDRIGGAADDLSQAHAALQRLADDDNDTVSRTAREALDRWTAP